MNHINNDRTTVEGLVCELDPKYTAELLVRSHEGLLSEEQEADLKDHLKKCERCRAEYKSLSEFDFEMLLAANDDDQLRKFRPDTQHAEKCLLTTWDRLERFAEEKSEKEFINDEELEKHIDECVYCRRRSIIAHRRIKYGEHLPLAYRLAGRAIQGSLNVASGEVWKAAVSRVGEKKPKTSLKMDGLENIKSIWEEFFKTRSEYYRNLLMENYRYLVKYAADRLHSKLPDKVELNDLISAGIFGLMDAIDAFDPERGVKFETYCSPRIRGSILDELRSMDWVIRLIRARTHRLETAIQNLHAHLGRMPTETEIAEELGLSMKEFHRLQRDVAATGIVTLNNKFSESSGEKDVREIDLTETYKKPGDTLKIAAEDSDQKSQTEVIRIPLSSGGKLAVTIRKDLIRLQFSHVKKWAGELILLISRDGKEFRARLNDNALGLLADVTPGEYQILISRDESYVISIEAVASFESEQGKAAVRNRDWKTAQERILEDVCKIDILDKNCRERLNNDRKRHLNLKNLLAKGLTRAERLIVVLYYCDGMTMKEIGATLDLSESRVSQMHTSIIARLRAQLKHSSDIESIHPKKTEQRDTVGDVLKSLRDYFPTSIFTGKCLVFISDDWRIELTEHVDTDFSKSGHGTSMIRVRIFKKAPNGEFVPGHYEDFPFEPLNELVGQIEKYVHMEVGTSLRKNI